MFLNKTLWLWCCSLCYLNGSHPWIPIHIVRLCPHAKPDRTSLWCLFIHAAIYYCLCFLTVQGTWLPKIQCNSIIAASACNHEVLHTHTQCNSHTSTLLSLHSSEGGERGRVQGHSSAHQWAVAGNSSDTSTPESCGFALSCLMWWTLLFASNPGWWIIYPFPHNLTESFSFHSSAYAGMLLHWN